MASNRCEWTTLDAALAKFVDATSTQSQAHIRPLHWHVASRLVLEGGFLPQDITPRPPFSARKMGSIWSLEYDPEVAGTGELNVLGGLKTKQVDVTVCKDGVGPVVAVSMKGSLKAFRNLTNRMEEAVGDCTNLHMSYPALVYGFLHLIRANIESVDAESNDIAIRSDGTVVDALKRYGDVLSRLNGRDDVRDVATKYESIALVLADTSINSRGAILDSFPSQTELSNLMIDRFFNSLYEQYDQRFVYSAPAISTVTRRVEWKLSDAIKNDTRHSTFPLREA